MTESRTPRNAATADGAHDREWDTKGGDLQYACTFALPTPIDCQNASEWYRCDCHAHTDSPLCDPTRPMRQVRDKAYPSLRPLALARKLGDQAVVGSVCPRESLDSKSPIYGYRPQMDALVDRIRPSLAKP